MTIEEKRKQLFEREYQKLDQQAAAHLLFVRDDGKYGYHTTRTAWVIFNAAIDAVEIVLPISEVEGCHGVELVCFPDDIRAAIESTGLGLKVKP